jgi:hypothetical protein
MAVVLTVPAEVSVGDIIKLTGTGFTNTGVIRVAVYAEGAVGGLEVRQGQFTLGATTFDSTGLLDVAAAEEGHVNFSVFDVTATTTTTARVKVSRRV